MRAKLISMKTLRRDSQGFCLGTISLFEVKEELQTRFNFGECGSREGAVPFAKSFFGNGPHLIADDVADLWQAAVGRNEWQIRSKFALAGGDGNDGHHGRGALIEQIVGNDEGGSRSTRQTSPRRGMSGTVGGGIRRSPGRHCWCVPTRRFPYRIRRWPWDRREARRNQR
jgi:hypothetical protein